MLQIAFRALSIRTLPFGLSLLMAACGGGNDGGAVTAPSSGQVPAQTANAGAGTGAMAHVLAAQAGDTEAALTPVAVTASASERGDLTPDKAIDHDESTRWSSGFSDDQWLMLDYGKVVAIGHVHIDWERAHAIRYELQVSADGSNWTTVKSVDNSQGGSEDWTELGAHGRYLRLKGLQRSSAYGYSVFEIQAFAGIAPAPAPSPTPGPAPVPSPVDASKPGVALKPVSATSSALENPANSAAMAVDGNLTTRWASAFEDGAWIQFDFGAKTAVGYMKLTWENAYGKEYSLRVSDDGQTWAELRHVSNGRGGVEEFFNLGANARYLRLQGVARATQYGYSLFEVEFKSPGSDNTLPDAATSAIRFPAGGAGLQPLPTAVQPLETLQFTLPDGTLVTRFGMVGRARHARERGEDWNEIGFGPNDTVDAAGNPQDKGPGNYLTFVPNYFKNRTWGVEILDNSRVAGVTAPTLVVNQYYQQAQRGGGQAFFRRFDDPGVTGYGWMSPGRLLDNSTYTAGFTDVTACPVVPKPPQGALLNPTGGYQGVRGANDGCSVVLDNVPGHKDIAANANGVMVPTSTTVPSRALKLGDAIEFTSSFFSNRASMDAMGDSGAFRYYANEMTYVVGTGLRPWYGVQPRLMNAPLPAATLSGGDGSISYNYSNNGLLMFQQPHNHIGMQNMQRFVEGRRLVHTNFTTGDHNEPGNDRDLAVVRLQGPRFNQSACIGCHVNNGRSPAPTALNQRLDAMSVRAAARDASGQQVPHPHYGTAIQMNALSVSGTPQDWGMGVRVAGFEARTVKLADGTVVELRKPMLAFDGPVPAVFSLRAAQPMIGTGLLEAVPEADILARARTVPDEDGVKGVPNYVFDPETGAVRLGRFGWKAGKASLRHQVASALLQDMSVTSPVYPNRACTLGPIACAAGKAEPGLSEADLQSVSRYLALVGVPAQRSLASGFPKGVTPLDEHRVDPLQISAGAKVFETLRCTACHATDLKTGPGHLFAELRNQSIKPYTDLLLHDMGAGLADGYIEGQASGGRWRTAPLWGIGYTDKVMGNSARVGYLHDGRARTLTEAVMWHAGEADKSRQRFEALSPSDRDALLAFLKSL